MNSTEAVAEYRTVSASSADMLDKAVNELLKDKWIPYGHPYSAGSSNGFFQAMIKRPVAGSSLFRSA